MIDIKGLVENPDAVKKNIENRKLKNIDVDQILADYQSWLKNNQILEQLQQQKNENAKAMKQKLSLEERTKLIENGKAIKVQLEEQMQKSKSFQEAYLSQLQNVPNYSHESVPIGLEGEGDVLATYNQKPEFDFEPKDYMTLAQDLDLIDFENAAKVSGSKFYFLKNEAALLEIALINFAFSKLYKKGFQPIMSPDLAKPEILEGIGFNPRGEETQVYNIDKFNLCLIGTSEITLGGMYSKQTLPKEKLPILMAGLSHCFRTEAGAAGMENKGLYRVHQFTKVEMFAITTPEDSEKYHDVLRDIEIEIYKELGLHFNVVNIPSADLGNPAFRKFDLEAWLPSRNDYCEITSTSNCTDYQSRRLNIKYKNEDGKNVLTHTLNGTACAIPRIIIALLEYGQNADGSISIPKALQPFLFGIEKIQKK